MSHQILQITAAWTPFEKFQALCGLMESFGISMNWIARPPEPVQNGFAAPQEIPGTQPADPFAKAEPPRERKKPGRKPKSYYEAGDAGHETIVESVEEMLIPDPQPATAAGPETEPTRKKPGRKPKVRAVEEEAA